MRRLLSAILLALGTTIAIFTITHVIPSDPAVAMLSDKASPQTLDAFRRRWGLDRSPQEQYLIYMRNLLKGDLGTSLRTGRPVTQDIAERAPATMELTVGAMLFSTTLGLGLGIIAALWRGRWQDVVVRLASLIGVSAPVFWTGVISIYLFFYVLNWLPAGGRLSLMLEEPRHVTGLYTIDSLISGNWLLFKDSLRHLLLPSISLGTYYMTLYVRLVRSSLIEEFQKDYFRTARSKGLARSKLVYRHALKNAAIPVLSYGGIVFGALLSGAVVTETIFSWPGLGRYAFQNALSLDFAAITGVTLIIGLMYVIINFLVDLIQLAVDPRVRIA
jgi:peptide/nickel transport system permease protein